MSQYNYFKQIADKLNITESQVASVINLLDEGATVPFIARYRKERTESLDEVQITSIRDINQQLVDLNKRRESILKSLVERELLTDELKEEIENADSLTQLEDIYLPFKPKRRTKATIAREKGLEELAEIIFNQDPGIDLMGEAEKFVNPEKEVNDVEEALSGARDIVAEWINEDINAREEIRELFLEKGIIQSKVARNKEEVGQKFKDYFEWSESVKTIPSHRMLALRRGENEDILLLKLQPEEDDAKAILDDIFFDDEGDTSAQMKLSIDDAYRRLMSLSMETELRLFSKKLADEEAIKVFAENTRQLLLSPPLGQKRVLAIDPGWRTGCKVVCLDKQGKLLEDAVIYPLTGEAKSQEAAKTVLHLAKLYDIEAIGVGNGTAGRETLTWLGEIGLPSSISCISVDECGASIYSASEVAREEFPDYDITVRGAVSIGRRLQDPLAELVKIDPKSIGVGQYQHDVDQRELKKSLDDVVLSCVNAVGVEVNTASKQLLAQVSGIGPQLAANVVDYRNENGAFKSRKELKKVPRLGDKAFEQSAGFLRIHNAQINPLDASAVHPESYEIVDKMADDLNCEVRDLLESNELREKINLERYITDEIGLPTLKDILAELEKPSRDPRDKFEIVEFRDGVNSINDLEIGMTLNGVVTNITRFGCFVDIGVHQDGLVHISQIANRYIKDPAEIVKLRQKVKVKVLEVDENRSRISLSMKEVE